MTEGRNGVWSRLLKARWLSGFAAAILLVGAFAAAGLAFGSPPGAQAATTAGTPMAIQMRIVEQPGAAPSGPIDILSFGWGMSREGPVDPGSRRVDVQDVTITKYIDASSTKLAEKCCKGDFFPEVEIHFCKTTCKDKKEYLSYELKNVIVTSYSVSGGSGDLLPVEDVTLSFTEVAWTYVMLDPETVGNTKTIQCAEWGAECTFK